MANGLVYEETSSWYLATGITPVTIRYSSGDTQQTSDTEIGRVGANRCKQYDGELCRGKDGTLRVTTPVCVVDLPPSTKYFPEPKFTHDRRFIATLEYLDRISAATISMRELHALARFIHQILVYAIHYRSEGRSRFAMKPGSKPQHRPLQKLKQLRKAAVKRDSDKIISIMSYLSEQCLTLITGNDEHPALELAFPEVLVDSLDKAIQNPKLYCRPERIELDRATAMLVAIFERVMDHEAKLANDPDTGRPASEIHLFVYKIGSIYDLPLVTVASDDRIAKVLQPDFKFEMSFPEPWSANLGWA